MGHQNVQLISAKDRTLEQTLNVVTRSGLAIDGVQCEETYCGMGLEVDKQAFHL